MTTPLTEQCVNSGKSIQKEIVKHCHTPSYKPGGYNTTYGTLQTLEFDSFLEPTSIRAPPHLTTPSLLGGYYNQMFFGRARARALYRESQHPRTTVLSVSNILTEESVLSHAADCVQYQLGRTRNAFSLWSTVGANGCSLDSDLEGVQRSFTKFWRARFGVVIL